MGFINKPPTIQKAHMGHMGEKVSKMIWVRKACRGCRACKGCKGWWGLALRLLPTEKNLVNLPMQTAFSFIPTARCPSTWETTFT